MAEETTGPRVLSLKRVAHELGLSRRTLERGIAAGTVKAVRLSTRRVGIPVTEVERIAEHGICAA